MVESTSFYDSYKAYLIETSLDSPSAHGMFIKKDFPRDDLTLVGSNHRIGPELFLSPRLASFKEDLFMALATARHFLVEGYDPYRPGLSDPIIDLVGEQIGGTIVQAEQGFKIKEVISAYGVPASVYGAVTYLNCWAIAGQADIPHEDRGSYLRDIFTHAGFHSWKGGFDLRASSLLGLEVLKKGHSMPAIFTAIDRFFFYTGDIRDHDVIQHSFSKFLTREGPKVAIFGGLHAARLVDFLNGTPIPRPLAWRDFVSSSNSPERNVLEQLIAG